MLSVCLSAFVQIFLDVFLPHQMTLEQPGKGARASLDGQVRVGIKKSDTWLCPSHPAALAKNLKHLCKISHLPSLEVFKAGLDGPWSNVV